MKLHRWIVGWVVVIAGLSSFLTAQQGAATQTASAVTLIASVDWR